MKMPSSDPWFVYILRCADGSLDGGITKDVKRRCQQHNNGTASRCTQNEKVPCPGADEAVLLSEQELIDGERRKAGTGRGAGR
jgi:GIY-YIG catalytic domain